VSSITATRISFSILSFDRYFDFNTPTAEKPASYKYHVTNGNSTRKALLAISGYSYLMVFQNPKSENEEKFIRTKN